MHNTLTKKLEEITQLKHIDQEHILVKALEIGIDRIWMDAVLSQYLKKKISRRKAIGLVGIENVRMAEYQNECAQEDVKWGLHGNKVRH